MAETRPLDKESKSQRGKADNQDGKVTGTSTNTGERPYFGTLQVRQQGVISRTRHLFQTTKGPALLPILLCGILLEVFYVLIVALSAVPALHLSSTPLVTAWSWTLWPSRALFAGAWVSARSWATQSWPYTLLLSGVLVAVTAVYTFVVRQVLRVHALSSKTGWWLPVLLGGALLFGLTLLLQPRLFSDDVFTYIFSGRILTIYHADPLNTAPIQFPADPYLRWVISGRYTPNIYGPLWLCVASVLVAVGNGPVNTLLLFKGVALLAHVLNCVLVWIILSKIAPTRRVAGTLLYAWNPLAIIELAGSGHNEGILLSVLLLATLLYVQEKRWWSEIIVLVLLGLATSMSLIVLLIAPLFTWFLVRTERDLWRALWGFGWRTLVGQGLVIPLYLPFWRGASTFFAITSAVDMEHFVHSPLGLLTGPTRWLFGLVDQWLHFPPVMQPMAAADVTLRASALFIFVLIYLPLFGKARSATTTMAGMRYGTSVDQQMTLPGFDVLLACWSIAVFWYLVLVMGWFWPWYVLWALWIVVLRQLDKLTITLLLLAATSLLMYPLLSLAWSPITVYQPILIFGIPLVYLYVNRKRQVEVA